MTTDRCITDNHQESNKATWCGKPEDPFEWTFMSVDQAAMNGRNGGYLTVCPLCLKAVVAGLSNDD